MAENTTCINDDGCEDAVGSQGFNVVEPATQHLIHEHDGQEQPPPQGGEMLVPKPGCGRA